MRTILLTGANRGLGLATARELLRAGDRLVITARTPELVEGTVTRLRREVPGAAVEGLAVELSRPAAIDEALALFAARPVALDVVVHNAGMLFAPRERTLTPEGVELVLAVNALAPLRLSEGLRPYLRTPQAAVAGPFAPPPCPARIVALGSSLHRPGSRGVDLDLRLDDLNLDRGYHPERAYKHSKVALLWAMGTLDRAWRAEGVRTDVVCPGFVPETAASGVRGPSRLLLRYVLPFAPFARRLAPAAQRMAGWIGAGLHADPQAGGRYIEGDGPVAPSADARDADKAAAFLAWARARWPAP